MNHRPSEKKDDALTLVLRTVPVLFAVYVAPPYVAHVGRSGLSWLQNYAVSLGHQ